ncbi:DUF3343 domain-containing protein [Crassaminicella thermophila]|uniref:DUF3343 domain-containing protein n=1 Tax=Crassaminicella thermophila TaxID=2599308 RepID=A0A5C0SHB0_CRATE|nr:DUF3343 domain-containing protein [Crassaminicella thermophila]QEK13711.1 DUF3343 domain-containing protein [Crassaminicella thermophila]
MLEQEFYVISFESTHHAIKTEKELKNKFNIETIPTPREISASCGLSIKFSSEIFSEVIKALGQDKEKVDIFKIKKTGKNKTVIKVL